MGSIVGGKNSLSEEEGLFLKESSIWLGKEVSTTTIVLLIENREKSVNISVFLMRVNSFRGIGSMRPHSLSTIGWIERKEVQLRSISPKETFYQPLWGATMEDLGDFALMMEGAILCDWQTKLCSVFPGFVASFRRVIVRKTEKGACWEYVHWTDLSRYPTFTNVPTSSSDCPTQSTDSFWPNSH